MFNYGPLRMEGIAHGRSINDREVLLKESNESGDEVYPNLTRIKQRRKRYHCSTFARILLYTTLAFAILIGISLVVLVILVSLEQYQDPQREFLPHWGQSGYLGDDLSGYPTDLTRDIIPIPCHSHNDYERRIPLYDAIHHGFTSVEADVWLTNNDLLVGHTESSLTQNRTFRSLYVDPIVSILDYQNLVSGVAHPTLHGVFDADPDQTLVLLVDVKTAGYETLPVVLNQLEPLRRKKYLTYFNGIEVIQGLVTVVLTGETPFDALTANDTYRDAFFDAPLDSIWKENQDRNKKLSEKGDAAEMPAFKSRNEASGQGHAGLGNILSASIFTPLNSYYASVSFADVFGWPQLRPMTGPQIQILQSQIAAAHKQGLKVRYWGTPGWPVGLRNNIWTTLVQEGIDMLNVDDLDSAAYRDWSKMSWI